MDRRPSRTASTSSRRSRATRSDPADHRRSATCTPNHLLSSAARGTSFADALAEAQRLGIAEADPRNDLEGWDAAAKAAILANALMGADLRPSDVERTPVGENAAEISRQAVRLGERVRPVAEIVRDEGTIHASFAPVRLLP